MLVQYRPFHKTRSSAFVNWISVRFYETSCMSKHTFEKIKNIKNIFYKKKIIQL